MKKIIVLAVALALLGGVAFAADNLSPRYLRMLSRESATDTIDIAYFNPAGTAFLEKGFHIQVNYQGAYLNYAHTLAGNEYASKTIVPFIPSGYLGYNGGQWAVFFGYNIPAGGGALTFEDGNYIFAAIGAG
ncbi:MAG: hypothetical protein MI892_17430, partial [Desulfobacterales bacterium]|nr:hypothetical protein [Desulfobacterales bacterium]